MTGRKQDNPMPEGYSNEKLADIFADYFMNKIQNIRDALQNISKYIPTSDENIPKLIEFNKPTQDKVKDIIMSMSTKSCQLDCMPTSLLKEILPSILPVITKIISLSLEKGVFVDIWKSAIVRPLIKKSGLDLTCNNYRPVSNLTFLSKVLEKVVLRQFMEHCDTNELMPDYQSAYRTHYSCETALVKLMDDLLWAMEGQSVTALMAIDLSAAFDTVDHEVLLSVLNAKFGLGGKALHWFNTYLQPRKCKVNVGSDYSKEKDLTFSVPQGSCAGPVLYLAYASAMQEIIPTEIDLHGYADDLALKNKFNPTKKGEELRAISNLENCAVDIMKWMASNRLKMNASKTEFILFGSRQQLEKCMTNQIEVDGEYVTQTDHIKYLGAYLDNNLNLKLRINNKCKTAMWNIQRIKQIRNLLTEEACETVIVGLVISHLDYANSMLIGIPECELKRLQRVQNIAAKLVLNWEYSAHECLKKLHWLPVRLRIKHKVLTLLFKSLRGESPKYLREMVEFHVPGRSNLRSENKFQYLKVPLTRRKTFAQRSYSVVAPMWWNELPNYIKQSDNVDIFKSRLKTFLFTKF